MTINRPRLGTIEDTISMARVLGEMAQRHKLSERRIAQTYKISKSEVHRLMILYRLDNDLIEAALKFNTEKYVLLDWYAIQDKEVKNKVRQGIRTGKIRIRSQLRDELKKVGYRPRTQNKIENMALKIKYHESEIKRLKSMIAQGKSK